MQDRSDPTVEKGWNGDSGDRPFFWKKTENVIVQELHATCKLCLRDAKTSNGG